MKAKYPGTCPGCSEPYAEGAEIVWRQELLYHQGCPDAVGDGGERRRGQSLAPHAKATQQGVATPGNSQERPAGNVAEPHDAPASAPQHQPAIAHDAPTAADAEFGSEKPKNAEERKLELLAEIARELKSAAHSLAASARVFTTGIERLSLAQQLGAGPAHWTHKVEPTPAGKEVVDGDPI